MAEKVVENYKMCKNTKKLVSKLVNTKNDPENPQMKFWKVSGSFFEVF
jgi:hypothetical protein